MSTSWGESNVFVFHVLFLPSLRCHTQAFSGCGRGLRPQRLLLRGMGSEVQGQELWCTGLAAQRQVGSSRTRDRARVSGIGRRILYHWAARETQCNLFKGKCMPLHFLLNVHMRLHICAFSCVVGGSESESCSVVSSSLQPHGLYSPWNSPGQDTGVGSLSLLQGIFPTQELNQGLLHCRWVLYYLSYQGNS